MSTSAVILPQFFPSLWRTKYGLAGSDFAPGVCLGLVERTDEGYYSFLPSDASAAADLETGLSNLAKLNDDVSVHVAHPENAAVIWITAEDNFAAVRMLVPTIKAQLISELGERFLFTIPSRDVCLFWSANAPPDLTSKHAREAIEDFESEEYNLTSRVLVYSDVWPCLTYQAGS